MPKFVPLNFVDVAAWVDSDGIDSVQRIQRQANHVLLVAIAQIRSPYSLYLKGGLLLGLVYNSPRMTVDVDMTAGFEPSRDIDSRLAAKLRDCLPTTVAMLGYVGTQIGLKEIKKLPKKLEIEDASFPSLQLLFEYRSGTDGRSKPYQIRIDVSFNEPEMTSVDIFDIGNSIELHAYSLVDVIAEKYRALLQQPIRRRERRQDVYDIDFLQRFDFDAKEKSAIHAAILEKCRARDIEPTIGSMDNPQVKEKACAYWDTIELETGRLPEFEVCFEKVRRFYRDLPWSQ